MNIDYISVWLAGVVSVLSPCVLPVIPTYIAFLSGNFEKCEEETGRKYDVIVNMVLFFVGFTLVFVAMGATASYVGELLQEHFDILQKLGGLILMLMGLQLMGIFAFKWADREYRPLLGRQRTGAIGSFMLGIAFTLGWTPCVGPVLAAVLMYAGMQATLKTGVLLLIAYAAGFAVPFVILTLVIWRWETEFTFLFRWMPVVQKISGALLVITGGLILGGYMQKILGFLL